MNNSYIADDDSRVVIFVDFLYNASRYFNRSKARKLFEKHVPQNDSTTESNKNILKYIQHRTS